MDFTAIKNRVYFLTGASSTDFPIADLTSSANRAVERVVSLINRHNRKWQFDDTNQTDLPTALGPVTSGQKDYALATTHLTIDRIEIKDTAGNWTLLDPIDETELTRDRKMALMAYRNTPGIPVEYDLLGASVFLYPTPNYTQASSLKLYFTRPPVAFLTTDTTVQPGFNPLFHDLISLWASYDYALASDKNNGANIFGEIQRKEQELIAFYGTRDRATRGRFTTGTDSNK